MYKCIINVSSFSKSVRVVFPAAVCYTSYIRSKNDSVNKNLYFYYQVHNGFGNETIEIY